MKTIIILTNDDLFKVKKIETFIDGIHINFIEILNVKTNKNCIFPDNSYDCYVILYNSVYYIFNLNEMYKISEFHSIDTYNIILKNLDKSTFNVIILLENTNTHFMLNNVFEEIVDENAVENCKKYVNDMNVILKKYCPQDNSINILFDYSYKYNSPSAYTQNAYNQLLLCLMKDDRCVSSVQIQKNNDIGIISSKTNILFEGKKYNKLLRTLILYIADILGFKYINSEAINPISAILLFNIYPDIEIKQSNNIALFKYMKTNNINIDDIKKLPYTELKLLFVKIHMIDLLIPVNEINLKSSDTMFIDTLSKITC